MILTIFQPSSSDTIWISVMLDTKEYKVMFSAAAHAKPLVSTMAHVPAARGTRDQAMLAG